jgi:beta-aspartyl-peptidase (threonine type)
MPTTFQPSDRAAITRVLDDQAAAWNRGDLDGFMAGYLQSDALVFTSGGQIRRGWTAARDHYRSKYGADRAAMGRLAFEVLQIDTAGADGAVVLGRWTVTGSEHPGTGIFSVVLERRPEGWRIIHDHTSLAAP